METTSQKSHAAATRPTPGDLHGKRIRWSWSDGPVKGSTHEHVFNSDGTVSWTCIGGPGKGHSEHEPHSALEKIADGVYIGSYRTPGGYTLTVALNERDHRVIGFASNEKEWHPCRGEFEIVD